MKPRIPAHYPKTSFSTRLFLWIRWWLTPYDVMASKLPKKGRILDLGCGHGLFTFALAEASKERVVVGTDHDGERTRLAREASGHWPNVQIQNGSMTEPPPGPFQGIAMIDVMHYFEPDAQRGLIEKAFSLLENSGTLIVREVDPEGGAASFWNKLYEKIATGIGFTKAQKEGLHFRSQKGWTELFESVGFQVSRERCSSLIFADVLYVCRKE